MICFSLPAKNINIVVPEDIITILADLVDPYLVLWRRTVPATVDCTPSSRCHSSSRRSSSCRRLRTRSSWTVEDALQMEEEDPATQEHCELITTDNKL